MRAAAPTAFALLSGIAIGGAGHAYFSRSSPQETPPGHQDTASLPSGALLTPSSQGPVIAQPGEFGLSREDLNFLEAFRRPLLESVPAGSKSLKPALRSHLEADFKVLDPAIVKKFPGLAPRERFLLYLMLRVNGSIPVYMPRGSLPNSLEDLVNAPRGNCSDFSARMLLVLDAFDIPARMTTFWSPSLPGHVVVEANDPQSGRAWLIDANNNILMWADSPTGGFFEALAAMPDADRTRILSPAPQGNLIQAPLFFRFYDPGVWLANDRPLTLDELNAAIPQTLSRYQASFGPELAVLLKWISDHPTAAPKTLSTLELPALRHYKTSQGLDPSTLLDAAAKSKSTQ